MKNTWLLFLLVGGVLGAQNLAEDVLKNKDFDSIEFKNYVGPHKVIETRAAIQGIGADLGRQMKASGTSADYAGKYRVQRLHDPASDLLSADLFILGPDAGVDHIRNLNWILSSYLQQAFGYSPADADLLANFVTRYNAFYRGQLDYIKSHYIPTVASNVTAENAGLALTYSDWPGKTRILIPLRDSLSKGLAGGLNAEEVSNKDITEKMKDDPGAGVEERKQLANIKENEIVQEQKAIAQAEQTGPTRPGTTPSGPTTNTPATTTATPTKTDTATKTESTTTTPTTTTPATTTAATTTTPTNALTVEEAKKDVAARDTALQEERKDIVKTEAAATKTETATAAVAKPAATTPFVRMSETTKAGQLLLVDPAKNSVWKRSELNSIRQNNVTAFGSGLLAVAGDSNAANGAVRLVLLSKDDATVLLTGTDDMLPATPVVVSGGLVLAVMKGDKGTWVLASFDSSLKMKVKGTEALSPLTGLTVTTAGLLVQSLGGGLILLDSTTLAKKSNTEG